MAARNLAGYGGGIPQQCPRDCHHPQRTQPQTVAKPWGCEFFRHDYFNNERTMRSIPETSFSHLPPTLRELWVALKHANAAREIAGPFNAAAHENYWDAHEAFWSQQGAKAAVAQYKWEPAPHSGFEPPNVETAKAAYDLAEQKACELAMEEEDGYVDAIQDAAHARAVYDDALRWAEARKNLKQS